MGRGKDAVGGEARLGPLIDADIRELIREYLRRKNGRGEELGHSQSSFTSNIRFTRNPLDFKLLVMRSYDEKSNLMVHLLKYEQYMEVAGAAKEIMCKCFSIYLRDLGPM